MARSVPEWIGTTPDTPIPPRVKRRVFDANGGICYLTGRPIGPADSWDAEHVIAMVNWLATPEAPHGNRESNLKPALTLAHREKSKCDVAEKSKVARIRNKHLGIKEMKRGFYKPAHISFNWNTGRYEKHDKT